MRLEDCCKQAITEYRDCACGVLKRENINSQIYPIECENCGHKLGNHTHFWWQPRSRANPCASCSSCPAMKYTEVLETPNYVVPEDPACGYICESRLCYGTHPRTIAVWKRHNLARDGSHQYPNWACNEHKLELYEKEDLIGYKKPPIVATPYRPASFKPGMFLRMKDKGNHHWKGIFQVVSILNGIVTISMNGEELTFTEDELKNAI